MTAVYTRDASWHNRPDVRTPKKYHRESAIEDLLPACGNTSVLNEDSRRDHADVLPSLLCGRCFPQRDVGGRGHHRTHDHTGMGS